MISTKPRNVDDVNYASADGGRPMREVLRERAVNARRYTRAQLEAAFRERAWMQGLLLSCLCHYPLTFVPTTSGHEAWCPSEHLYRNREARNA